MLIAFAVQPRATRVWPKAIDAHRPFLERRGPEVGWNGMVLLRELRAQGFTGGYQQIQRALQPLRTTRRWAARATARFETGPGEQAQIDFGQLRVWIGEVETPVHVFVCTLGFSRRAVAYAYRNERLDRCSMGTSARCGTLAESGRRGLNASTQLWDITASHRRCDQQPTSART